MNDHFVSRRQKLRSEILAALLIIQLISWVWVLANSWYSMKNFDSSKVFFVVKDQSWWGQTKFRQVPLWGEHYFGDLQIFHGWVGGGNPYEWMIKPPIPPFGLRFYSLLNFRGPQVGLFIWLSLTCLFSVLITHLWLKSETLSDKITAYCALVLVNTSVLYGLDRGNILLILMTIVGLLFFKVLNSKHLTGFDAFLLASAISLKPYLLLLLLFFVIERKFRFVFFTTIFVLVCNFFATLIYNWNTIDVFTKMFIEQSRYNNSNYADFSIIFSTSAFRVLADSVQLVKGVDYMVALFNGSSLLVALPGILYLVLVTTVCLRRDIPIWIRMISILSTIQMVVAATPRYNIVWTFVGGLLILQQPKVPSDGSVPRISRREFVVAFGCGLGFLVGGLPIALSENLSPLVWIIVICLIFVIYVIPKRQNISQDLSVNSKSEGMKLD